MKTIILNGSPKGNAEKSGSYLIAKAFVQKMKNPCEIMSIAKEDNKYILEKIKEVDTVIMIVPNYIHSIPSGALEFVYSLPYTDKNQSIGFIIQSGYPESSESMYISKFLENYVRKQGYQFLGNVIKGECAGLAIMPDKFGKLLAKFTEFGARFEETGEFDKLLMEQFANPLYLPKFQERLFNFLNPLSNFMSWGSILRKNGSYAHRLDAPYLK